MALWAAVIHHLGTTDTVIGQQQHKFAVTVPPPLVSKYLCRGADLMTAGMRNIPSNTKHRVLPICIQGNPQPFAVGKLRDDIQKIGVGTKGVGMEIWSCYGDDLWRQQQQPHSETNNHIVMNQVGGAAFDDGHYGNVGFVDGTLVHPITSTSTAHGGEKAVTATGLGADGDDDDDSSSDEVEKEDCSVAKVEPGDADAFEKTAHSTSPDGITDDDRTSRREDAMEEITSELIKTTVNDVPDDNSPPQSQEEENNMTPEEVLHAAVCKALVSLPKADLPMNVATFYANHVLPNRPEGTTIQLKATRYKKFAVYLNEQQVENHGLIHVAKKKGNADLVITGFDKRHADLKVYYDEKGVNQDSAATSSTTSQGRQKKKKLVIVNLYMIPHHWIDLLRLDTYQVRAENASSEERKGTGMLTAPEARTILETYLEQEALVDSVRKDMVHLNGPLTDVLYKTTKPKNQNTATTTPQPPETLPRKDLVKLWIARMSVAYALVEMPGSKILQLQRGPPPKVEIEVSMRQSKKFVTRVRGLEDYQIDPTAFSKDVARRFACSASIETDPVAAGRAALKKKGRVELVFQGNLVNELEALLVDEKLSDHGGAKGSTYSVPKNALDVVLRKGVPSSGKKKR